MIAAKIAMIYNAEAMTSLRLFTRHSQVLQTARAIKEGKYSYFGHLLNTAPIVKALLVITLLIIMMGWYYNSWLSIITPLLMVILIAYLIYQIKSRS